MQTVEKPMTPAMRQALASYSSTVDRDMVFTSILLWGVAAFALLTSALMAGLALMTPLSAIALIPLVPGTIFLAVTVTLAIYVPRQFAHTQEEIQQDLDGGVYWETTGEMSIAHTRNERQHVFVGDRKLPMVGPWTTGLKFLFATPLNGGIVRYSPQAGLVLEVVAPDGDLIYQSPALRYVSPVWSGTTMQQSVNGAPAPLPAATHR